MALTKLEKRLFESVEFHLALLNAIPMPIFLVNNEDRVTPLNSGNFTCSGNQVCCAHSKDIAPDVWDLDPDKACILCKTVKKSRESGKIEQKKGSWHALVDGVLKEFVIVVHAVPTKIKDENYVLIALEDLTEVEQLKGLLPICMQCNKIHNDKNDSWTRLDRFISDHSPAKFSHGLCPECAKDLMDDLNK